MNQQRCTKDKRYIMECDKCGTTADIRNDPHAWDGWMGKINKAGLMEHTCPDCQNKVSLEQALDRR